MIIGLKPKAERKKSTVFASLEGKPFGDAQSELDEIAGRILPADYLPKYQGMAEVMKESLFIGRTR